MTLNERNGVRWNILLYLNEDDRAKTSRNTVHEQEDLLIKVTVLLIPHLKQHTFSLLVYPASASRSSKASPRHPARLQAYKLMQLPYTVRSCDL